MVVCRQPVLLGLPSQGRIATPEEEFVPNNGLLGVASNFVGMSDTFDSHGGTLGPVRQREQLNGTVFVAVREFYFGFQRLEIAHVLGILGICKRTHFFEDIRGLSDASCTGVLPAEP